MTQQKTRKLIEIVAEIYHSWKNVNFGAQPYLLAMARIDSIDDYYVSDSGWSIVRYFLGNATTWRGETARRIKAELRAML